MCKCIWTHDGPCPTSQIPVNDRGVPSPLGPHDTRSSDEILAELRRAVLRSREAEGVAKAALAAAEVASVQASRARLDVQGLHDALVKAIEAGR